MSASDEWYITESGVTAHQSRGFSSLSHATVVGTLTGDEVDDDYVLRRCDMCRYNDVPVLS